MPIALFDLDHTLLDGDSDYLWGEFLCDRGVVDRDWYRAENARYYRAYREGRLDIHEFLNFGLDPLTRHPLETLHRWREDFVRDCILPIIPADARALLDRHRQQGHRLAIVTATNRFVTAPIAAELGVANLLATEPEFRDGRYTGRVKGTPCFREGKIRHVEAWLAGQNADWADSWFYSDSHNDLPLLERVRYPVAVNPDPQLAGIARERGWPVKSLRAPGGGDPRAVRSGGEQG